MNVMELKLLLDEALLMGINPETEVVIGGNTEDHFDWAVIKRVHNPAALDGEDYSWFTLMRGDECDWRIAVSHYHDEPFTAVDDDDEI